MSRKAITAPDGVPSLMTAEAVYATGMVSPFLPGNRASSSRTVRPVRMASPAGTSRKPGAIKAPSLAGSSIVISTDGSFIDRYLDRRQLHHVGRGPVDEGQLPVCVYGADAFSDVEGDRGEPLAPDMDLLV